MFSSSRMRHAGDSSFSKHRAGKTSSSSHSNSKVKRSFRGGGGGESHRLPSHLDLSSSKTFEQASTSNHRQTAAAAANINHNSAVTTISVGPVESPRMFAAHEDVLRVSPYFSTLLHSAYYLTDNQKLSLPTETPEVFAAILEFLYKGDYFPQLEYDSRKRTWHLSSEPTSSTVWVSSAPASPTLGYPADPNTGITMNCGAYILKDTAIYCAAERYGLGALKRLALRKQGLQSGIPVSTILASARYAYANTPDTDSKLRAHYLALIIRSRNTFKRSGTMQAEMSMLGSGSVSAPASPAVGLDMMSGVYGPGTAGAGAAPAAPAGTGLWFDLFVAMCNHLDDMEKLAGRS